MGRVTSIFDRGAPHVSGEGGSIPLKHETLKPDHTVDIANLILKGTLTPEQIPQVQDIDTSYSLPGVARFRVNVYRQRGSLALVLRIVPSEIPTLEKLGLPPIVQSIAEVKKGLVLVTGATGAGKSSTLAAMINHINNTRKAHILTIEDPLEFLHRNNKSAISQREIGSDTSDYVAGLRSALRQDPDVILVGEMRDAESFSIALKASETGHVVFSTVHTTDATRTLGRLVSMFPPEEQEAVRHRIAENLRATISQQLIPEANGTGICAAMEIMIVTATIRECIIDMDKTASVLHYIEKGRDQYQMQSFDQHLKELYDGGVIDIDTAIRTATNPSDFRRSITLE